MTTMKNLIPFLILLAACSCSVSKNYNPAHKFSPAEMQEDYHLFRNILEESHPSLYWYTPKDSMDRYFELGAEKLKDSLTEDRFRYVLSYVLAKIRCGHTTTRPSKEAVNYAERNRSVQFPLAVKAWKDTAVLISNLIRHDTSLKRGVLLTSIDGRPMQEIEDSMFQFLGSDGYNMTHQYQSISSSGVFRSLYAMLYGLRLKTPVQYIDTAGVQHSAILNLYDTVHVTPRSGPLPKQPSKKERKQAELLSMRSLRVDTALHTAFMQLNTFSKGNSLRRFFRQSFRTMRQQRLSSLVVDIRGNGGGSVTLSTLLTKYLADQPFKIADSLYAITNKSRYHRYESDYFIYRLLFMMMVRKRKDGLYHFPYFENRYFQPRARNHFSGQTYILTGGNTFSAAALFAKALRNQDDVTIVGEETGGGAYGNTAWLIPEVTLPNTHVRFRLPLFRLVIDKFEQKGRGILPEVPSLPTTRDIRRNADYKMEKAIELIKARS